MQRSMPHWWCCSECVLQSIIPNSGPGYFCYACLALYLLENFTVPSDIDSRCTSQMYLANQLRLVYLVLERLKKDTTLQTLYAEHLFPCSCVHTASSCEESQSFIGLLCLVIAAIALLGQVYAFPSKHTETLSVYVFCFYSQYLFLHQLCPRLPTVRFSNCEVGAFL